MNYNRAYHAVFFIIFIHCIVFGDRFLSKIGPWLPICWWEHKEVIQMFLPQKKVAQSACFWGRKTYARQDNYPIVAYLPSYEVSKRFLRKREPNTLEAL